MINFLRNYKNSGSLSLAILAGLVGMIGFIFVFSIYSKPAFATDSSLQLTLSKHAISIVIPQGGIAQVATLSSSGARQFAFTSDPTTSKYRIRWNQVSGAITPGQSLPINILVDSTVPIGDYTGVAVLTNPTNNSELQIPVEVHVVSSDFHFSLTPSFISVTIPQGGIKQVMVILNLSSKSANSVTFGSNSISDQPGIKWSPTLPAIWIGAPYGTAIPSIYVSSTVPVGTYSGTTSMIDNYSKQEVRIPVTINVTAP